MELGRIGIWSGQLRASDSRAAAEIPEAAAELDELGYAAIWVPGGAGTEDFENAEAILSATKRAVMATGILNIWMHEPGPTAAEHARLAAAHPDRFLLGIGVGHAPAVNAKGKHYARPYAALSAFLDGLDAAAPPVPREERIVAALGPRMLRLAEERTLGTHPYLTTADHTRTARELLGAGPMIAPDLKVVDETDAGAARALARKHLSRYLALPNYTNNFLRMGFTEADIADGGSDRLVDGLYAWGDIDSIAARVTEHFDAGADHVCIQVVPPSGAVLPRQTWRSLAEALIR